MIGAKVMNQTQLSFHRSIAQMRKKYAKVLTVESLHLASNLAISAKPRADFYHS